MTEKKKLMKDEHLEGVSGGIPGQLIAHTVSAVVNTLLGSDNTDAAGKKGMPGTHEQKLSTGAKIKDHLSGSHKL